MIGRLRSRFSDCGGTSVIELSIALLVSSMVIALMVTWAGAVVGVEVHHSSDDDATQALRVAKEELSKDIRQALAVTGAADGYLGLWIDLDRDDVQDVGEGVSWAMSASGQLVRSDDAGGSRTAIEGLLYEASGFTYTSGPGGVESVAFELVAEVATQTGAVERRSIAAEIHVRNT